MTTLAFPDPFARLHALKLELPPPPPPVGNFVTHVREGSLLFLSGQGPREADGYLHTGRVGENYDVDQAYAMARLTGLNLLSVMAAALGDLRRVRRIVKVLGMVNAVPDFKDHPKVINGCSDLFVEVFGTACGAHARSSVGLATLPDNIPVEIEAIVAFRE